MSLFFKTRGNVYLDGNT